jgi:hypothetical protein
VILVSLALCNSLQGIEAGPTRQLKSFAEIREFVLTKFGVITSVYDLSKCTLPKGFEFYEDKIYVEHLNDVWLWVKHSDDSEVLRASDVFLEGKWIFVQPQITDKDEATLNIAEMGGGDIKVSANFTAACKIGEGASFYAQDHGAAKEEYSTYDDMKAAVRSGKELVARALTTKCPGPSWEAWGITDFVAAYKIHAARIENEGTEDEQLVFNFYLFSDKFQAFTASPVVLETVAYTMKPDGSARVDLGPIDLTNFKIPFKPVYNCTIGETYFVGAIASDKHVKKYHTYDDVLDAVKAGQTIDTIMDARLCTWKGGKKPDDTEIHMRRFSPWVHGVDKPQYGNFIGFFDLNYNNIPNKFLEKFWVFDNDTVLYEKMSIDPAKKTQEIHSATCTIGCSIKFSSSERPREVVGCVDGLKAALLRGEYVTYMLDYDKCEGPDFVFDAHGGGLLEHAEIDPATDGSIHSTGKAIATFLTSGEAVRVQQPVTVHQNGTVVVVSDTHVTDETFKKIGKTSVFTCKLGESAFFFA